MIKNVFRTFSFALMLSSTQWSGAAILSGLNQPKVDAQLIPGKWQCEYTDPQMDMWSEDEYRSDGQYFAIGSIQMKEHSIPITFELTLEARWELDGNQLFFKDIKLTELQGNHDQFGALLEAAYKNYTSVESRIENFTESSMRIRAVTPVVSDHVSECQKH